VVLFCAVTFLLAEQAQTIAMMAMARLMVSNPGLFMSLMVLQGI
jgi:hypothetical protein